MATDDQQILVTGQASAPTHFTISGNGQIRPKTIFAHFDGTGAAGSFRPALKIVSDGGKTIGIYPTDETLAAGGTADVSWFPGVGGGQNITTIGPAQCVRVNQVGDIAVAEGDPGVFVSWGEATIDTGNPTPFWSAGVPLRVTCPVDGIYLSMVNFNFGDQATPTDMFAGCYLYRNGAAFPNFTYEDAQFNVQPDDSYLSFSHGLFTAVAGDYFEILAYNFNTALTGMTLKDERPAFNHYSSWNFMCLGTI